MDPLAGGAPAAGVGVASPSPDLMFPSQRRPGSGPQGRPPDRGNLRLAWREVRTRAFGRETGVAKRCRRAWEGKGKTTRRPGHNRIGISRNLWESTGLEDVSGAAAAPERSGTLWERSGTLWSDLSRS